MEGANRATELLSEMKNGDKAYLVIVTDGKIHKINIGFNALELLGICSWNTDDIIDQLIGRIKPEIIERKVYENEENRGEEKA